MSNQKDKQESVELEQVNDKLTQGLKCCHKLLFDYRTKLEANGKLPEPPVGNGEKTRA